MSQQLQQSFSNKVIIREAIDGWEVVLVEGSNETISNFPLESFALSFAEGQLLRLGAAELRREPKTEQAI